MDIPIEKYEEIVKEIGDANSMVGIDAKKTHVIIIHKLIEIEKRLARLEGKEEDVSKDEKEYEIIDDNFSSGDVDSIVEVKTTGDVSTEELAGLLKSEGNFVLVDVREVEEVRTYGMIPKANNVPLGEIEGAFSSELDDQSFKEAYGFRKPDVDEVVIFYCRSGSRSDQATEAAKRLGYKKARNYKGSIWEWAEIDENVKRYGPPPF